MFFSVARTLSFVLASAVAVNAAIYDIQVGGSAGALTFSPEAIGANPGDQVVFHFQQKNHTVTQSSFASPCGQEEGGFDSGFMPVPANQTDNFPTYTITVNDTKPIWVYCKQAANTPNSHCGAGMVFAINCGADGAPNSFTNFKAAALAEGARLKAAASSAATASSAMPTETAYTTAAYGDATIPAAPTAPVVTATITVDSTSWTTTYSSYPGSPAATPISLEGEVHKVTVGANGTLAFDPPFVVAQPRDTILFEFRQKNHTVTQSSFDGPCLKAADANGVPALDSGFMPVTAGATDFPTWAVKINDTKPLWFYCKQGNHCGAGMVFAVNPVQSSARSFDAFQKLAIQLNGTSSSSASTSSGAASPSSSSTTSNNSAAGMGMNLALGLGSVLALFAALL